MIKTKLFAFILAVAPVPLMTISMSANATGIPVFDGGNFANMIINAANQATQISQQVSQVNQAIRGNGLSEQMLKQLGVSNYSGMA